MPLREESFIYLILPGLNPPYREVRIVIKGRSHGGAVCWLTPFLVLALFSFTNSYSALLFSSRQPDQDLVLLTVG